MGVSDKLLNICLSISFKFFKDRIKIIPVTSISEVFEYSFSGQKPKLLEKLKKFAAEKKLGIILPETIPTPSGSL